MSPRITRRDVLRVGSALLLSSAVGRDSAKAAGTEKGQKQESRVAEKLRVSVVQFRSSKSLEENTERHCEFVRRCAADGARIVVFPECSIPGYYNEVIPGLTLAELDAAEAEIGRAAKEVGAYVIAGSVTKLPDKTFNSAVVITPDGRIIERYHKVQLAGEPWAVPGDHLSVFPIDGVLCSIIVCHDERYPELVRLPVIAGARLVFYISHESGMDAKSKIEPYRAQIVARAVENNVFIAHSNAPAIKEPQGGSHGQSRIIGPGGHIIHEAGFYDEEVLTAELNISDAHGGWARQSVECDFLKSWWQSGAAKVRMIGV